jgi:hypothetical protein
MHVRRLNIQQATLLKSKAPCSVALHLVCTCPWAMCTAASKDVHMCACVCGSLVDCVCGVSCTLMCSHCRGCLSCHLPAHIACFPCFLLSTPFALPACSMCGESTRTCPPARGPLPPCAALPPAHVAAPRTPHGCACAPAGWMAKQAHDGCQHLRSHNFICHGEEPCRDGVCACLKCGKASRDSLACSAPWLLLVRRHVCDGLPT